MRSVPLLLFAAALTAGAQPNSLTPAEKAAGWKLLFNGKSMQGWADPAKLSPAGDSWTIEDGCLKARPHPKLREDLFTKEEFGDFELSFEWKISPKGNSGVKYRVQDRFYIDERRLPEFGKFENLANDQVRTRATKRANASQEYVVGFEYQVIDNAGHADALRGGYYQAGALYGMIPPTQAAEKPVGEFNTARIVVKGDHVEHWLNGIKVIDGSLTGEAGKKRTAARWTTESPIYRNLTEQPKKRGPLTLQNHGDAAWFRNIKVRSL